MHLSWNEIRARAARFADEWKDAHYERGETQSFYNEFFEVFGIRRRRVASFEEPVKKLGNRRGFIDLFWKGVLLIEQKSAKYDLKKAKEQALDYFPGLKEHELPRYVLLSDFQTFELYDLDENEEVKFGLAELPSHVEAFGFIIGVQSRHSSLTAYLFDASALSDRHLVVRRAIRPLNGLPRLAVGSKPVDDGHYIFSDEEKDRLYRAAAFRSNRERVEHLIGLYERLVTPLAAISPPSGRRTRQSKQVSKSYAMTPTARSGQRPLSN